MPIQFNIKTISGDTVVTLFNNAQSQIFEVPISAMPTGIQIDPQNWILKDIVGISSVETNSALRKNFYLSQNYPNPFNPKTKIKFVVPGPLSHPSKVGDRLIPVSLKVYDIHGRKVATLVNENKLAGEYEVEFCVIQAARKFSASVYFYQLRVGDFVETK